MDLCSTGFRDAVDLGSLDADHSTNQVVWNGDGETYFGSANLLP